MNHNVQVRERKLPELIETVFYKHDYEPCKNQPVSGRIASMMTDV